MCIMYRDENIDRLIDSAERGESPTVHQIQEVFGLDRRQMEDFEEALMEGDLEAVGNVLRQTGVLGADLVFKTLFPSLLERGGCGDAPRIYMKSPFTGYDREKGGYAPEPK